MQQLLLLHGALGSEAHFDNLKAELSKDFEIFTFNFKGHGGTEIPNHDFTIAGFAEETIAFLDRNNIEKIMVFGYSMGGYVAMYLAKHFPERIEKLFTLATKWDWNLESAMRESKMLNPETIKEKVPKYAESLAKLHGENWPKMMQKTVAMMLQLGANPAFKSNDLSEITIPTRIAVGDKDVMVSIEESLAVYRSLPDAQFHVMASTQHPIDRVNVSELAHQIRNYF